MANLVNAEETAAILALANEPSAVTGQVRARDFAEPRRLSAPQTDRLARVAARVMPELEAHLRTWLRSVHTCRVQAVVESSTEALLPNLSDPFSIVAFECAGQTGWGLLDAAAIVAMCEIALGADEVHDPKARKLTSVEGAVLVDLLARPLTLIAQSLGVDAKNPRIFQDRDALERREDPLNADPQRIVVLVAIEGALGPATLRVYLAGVRAPDVNASTGAPTKDKAKPALPQHTHAVDVEISARLGSIDVPLSELLAVEVGDVIPLGIEVGSPVVVHVENEACAIAQFGERHGKLAIRILKLGGPNPPRE